MAKAVWIVEWTPEDDWSPWILGTFAKKKDASRLLRRVDKLFRKYQTLEVVTKKGSAGDFEIHYTGDLKIWKTTPLDVSPRFRSVE